MVDKPRGVVRQPHRLRLAKACTMTTCDKCHAEAVAGGSARAFERDVELAVLLSMGEIGGCALTRLEDVAEMLCKCVWERHAKAFARVGIVSLGVGDPQDLLLKVDGLGTELGFAEAATDMRADFKDGEHPRRCRPRSKSRAGFSKALKVKIGLLSDRLTADEREAQGVLLAILTPKSLLEDEGVEFDLKACGVVLHALALPPCHEIGGVLVAHMHWVANASLVVEIHDAEPRGGVALQRLRLGVVLAQIRHNPLAELARIGGAHLRLGGRGFLRHAVRRPGLLRTVMPQPRRLLPPRPRLQITKSQHPIRRMPRFFQISHVTPYSPKLPHATTKKKWFEVGQDCKSVLYVGKISLPLHHRASLPLDFVALTEDSPTAPPNFSGVASVQRRAMCLGGMR